MYELIILKAGMLIGYFLTCVLLLCVYSLINALISKRKTEFIRRMRLMQQYDEFVVKNKKWFD